MEQQGVTLWFSGPQEEAITAIRQMVEKRLRKRGYPVERLDVEAAGELLRNGSGLVEESEEEIVSRFGFVAQLLSRNGVIVLVSAEPPTDEVQEKVGPFVQVRMQVRDQLGAGAARRMKADVYETQEETSEPEQPETEEVPESPKVPIVKCRPHRESPQQSARKVLKALEELGYIEPEEREEREKGSKKNVFKKVWNRLRQGDIVAVTARNTGIALIIQTIGFGVRFAQQIVLARLLGHYEYGLYSYANVNASWMTTLAGLGLPRTVTRFMPAYLVLQDWGRLRGVMRQSQLFTFCASLVISCLGTVVVLLIQHYNPQFPYGFSLLIGVWLVPLLTLEALYNKMSRAAGRVAMALAPHHILQPALLIVGALLIYFATGTLLSTYALGALVFSYFVSVILIRPWLWRPVLPKEVYQTQPVYETRQWLNAAFPFLFISGMNYLMHQTDTLLVGALRGPSEVGIYNAAYRIAGLVSFIFMAVNITVAPNIAALHAQGKNKTLQRMIASSAAMIFWPTLAVALLLILFSEPLLHLFGPRFIESRPALIILCLGQVVNALAGPVQALMNKVGNTKQVMKVFVVTALYDILACTFLIPRFGIVGAAIGTASTLALWNSWLHSMVVKEMGVRPSMISIWLARLGRRQ